MQPHNVSERRNSAEAPQTDRLLSWKNAPALFVLALVASMIVFPEALANLAKPSAVDKTKITYPIR